jgi:hypothetical protein
MMRGLFPLYPGMMSAAAPDGAPRGGSVTNNSKNNSHPPFLGEAMGRGSFIYNMIFIVRRETN